jgi:hypothetical protein
LRRNRSDETTPLIPSKLPIRREKSGRTFAVNANFREFARVELWDGTRDKGAFWFRISNYFLWHHYMSVSWNPAFKMWENAGSSSGYDHLKP